jgi:hypothetical protein
VRCRLVCPDLPLPALRTARHERLASCLVVNTILIGSVVTVASTQARQGDR